MKQGHIPWNKGLHKQFNNALAEWRAKGGTNKGKKAPWAKGTYNPMHDPINREKIRLSKLGKKNPRYGKFKEESVGCVETSKLVYFADIPSSIMERHQLFINKVPFILKIENREDSFLITNEKS